MTTTSFYRLAALLSLAALVGARPLAAQEADAKFETTASLGATLTDGNSETMNLHGSLITEGEKPRLGSYRFGLEGQYGETTTRTSVTLPDGSTVKERHDETTVEKVKLFGNVKKSLSERTFTYVDGSVLYDDVAEIDYRAIAGPGLGYYLLKDDAFTLTVEAGAAYLWEEVADVRDDYATARLAERFEYRLNDRAKLWQSFEYLPEIGDGGNYLLNGEIGIEAAVNSRLNLRLTLNEKYDSEPGDGLKRSDLTLIAGLSFKL